MLGDATKLSFPDGRFSGAVCFSMLHHVPSPELQDRLKKLSAETFGGSSEKAAKYMREEVKRWGDVIKAADIKLE